MSKKKIEAFFKNHPKVKVVFVTSDGFKFILRSDAGLHAKKLKDNTITPWHRPEAEKTEDGMSKKAPSDMTVAEVGEWAETISDIAELENALNTVEFKGAKEAIEARIASLSKKE